MLLVLNTGSSSIKIALYRDDLSPIVTGNIAGIGGQADLSLGDTKKQIRADTHADGITALLAALDQSGINTDDLTAAAHRVVHGGTTLTQPIRLTENVIATIEANVPLAPLHNPPALAGIRAMQAARPNLPQYASFDTAFHACQPALATTYAIPKSLRDAGIRRYGFHGLSYAGMVESFGASIPPRLLAMHLGAGVSLCAIKNGHSLATSMGYSPLSGPPMATRSGDIDGMAVLRLADEVGTEKAALILNKSSGLLALGGSSDMRELLTTDSDVARFAIDHFVWFVVHQAGSLIASMGGVDAIAFTGGIGENSTDIRNRIVARLAWLGDIPTHVVPAEEEKQIARDALGLIRRGV